MSLDSELMSLFSAEERERIFEQAGRLDAFMRALVDREIGAGATEVTVTLSREIDQSWRPGVEGLLVLPPGWVLNVESNRPSVEVTT